MSTARTTTAAVTTAPDSHEPCHSLSDAPPSNPSRPTSQTRHASPTGTPQRSSGSSPTATGAPPAQPTPPYAPPARLLNHHGDRDVDPELVDLAVNVRSDTPPAWLARRLRQVDLASYPDHRSAHAAVAERHRRQPDEVLLTAGAAEAFVLIARTLRPRHAVVIHPQFTEPEVALRAAGHDVERLVLEDPFILDPDQVPEHADLVIIGNPTNPTSVLHPLDTLRALTRPGRTLVVDEAFMDCVPGEAASLASLPDLTGVIVIRSLTKTWGLAGLRAGYVLADPALVRRLAAGQPPWPVSSAALLACELCSTPSAIGEARDWAEQLLAARTQLCRDLARSASLQLVADPRASFVLLRSEHPELWNALRSVGYATRRGDTFPGLGPHYLRIAVRTRTLMTGFLDAVTRVTPPPA